MPKANTLAATPECAQFIILAATELLAEVGYGAMSMRQLASRAGILPGSLYHHVASKQDLLSLVLMDLLQARDRAWRGLPRRRGVLSELQSFIRFVLAWQVSHPLHVKVLARERHYLQPHLQAWLCCRPDNLQLQLQALLQRGLRQGVFTGIEVESASLAIMALLGTADTLHERSPAWTLSHMEAHFLQMTRRLLGVKDAQVPAPQARLAHIEG
ncbi:helix-turn-helix domain containing protein [Pseudomonas kermanshahensis]|uniref:TetR/AcrR family transcriptional regulator n=1 Tax=Pseudomonas kermanshahensis TaxID=2745482 RepID=UPI0023DC7BE7|nr:TetR/AcrR family transcriptional regulator [Pseudomonas kermanshahensis]WEL57745.1 helix-turn-helix domain containing protein [Pseudomonas kermanshahensis]